MFVVVWLRWLRGTVAFLITGAFPERLIESCMRNGLPVWGIQREKQGLAASAYAADYRSISRMARGQGVRTRVVQKSGLWVLRHRYRRRGGFVAGAVAVCLLLGMLSQRVWSIEINGCQDIPAREVTAELAQMGLRPGVRRRDLDVREMQYSMMLLDDRISWIAINLVGSVAKVQLRERLAPPARQDYTDRLANVVAAEDGQILRMEVYEGQPLCQIGDTVQKGQVVVSGIMEDQYGKRQLRYARALVVAQCYEQLTAEVPLAQQCWTPQGDPKGQYFLQVGSLQLPLGPAPRFAKGMGRQTEPPQSLAGGLLTRVWHRPMQLQTVTLTEHQAKEQAMLLLQKQRAQSGESIKVLSRRHEGKLQNGVYTLTELALVEKDIALESEILREAAPPADKPPAKAPAALP